MHLPAVDNSEIKKVKMIKLSTALVLSLLFVVGCVPLSYGRPGPGSTAYPECNSGYGDCDGDPTNGCEALLDPLIVDLGSCRTEAVVVGPPTTQYSPSSYNSSGRVQVRGYTRANGTYVHSYSRRR